MNKSDVEELQNALVGARETLDYIEFLCKELGYIPNTPTTKELETA